MAKKTKTKTKAKPAKKAVSKAKPKAKAKQAKVKAKAKPVKKYAAKTVSKKAKPAQSKGKVKTFVKPKAKTKTKEEIIRIFKKANKQRKEILKAKYPYLSGAATKKPKTKSVIKAVKTKNPAPPKAQPKVSEKVKVVVHKEIKKTTSTNGFKTRYSDKDLGEFKEIIISKLAEARKDLDLLRSSMSHLDDHGTDDTSPTFKLMEDGSDVLNKEETAQLAARQQKFIKHLEDAMVRIENKSYGICRITGNLIPKERLRIVPHATLSIEAKQKQF